jgi:hypothetical protein
VTEGETASSPATEPAPAALDAPRTTKKLPAKLRQVPQVPLQHPPSLRSLTL